MDAKQNRNGEIMQIALIMQMMHKKPPRVNIQLVQISWSLRG